MNASAVLPKMPEDIGGVNPRPKGRIYSRHGATELDSKFFPMSFKGKGNVRVSRLTADSNFTLQARLAPQARQRFVNTRVFLAAVRIFVVLSIRRFSG